MEIDQTILVNYAYGLLLPEVAREVRSAIEKDEFLQLEYKGIIDFVKDYPDDDMEEVIARIADEASVQMKYPGAVAPPTKVLKFAGNEIVDKKLFAKLVADIVYDLLPDERIAYDLAGTLLVDELFARQDIIESNGAIGVLNFSEHPESIIYFTAIAAATFDFYEQNKSRPGMPDRQAAIKDWLMLLREKGIGEGLSEKVVNGYIGRFL